MNKADILNRSKNQYSDEREEQIENRAGANAFYIIFLCNLILIIVISFQKVFTGEAFADPNIFAFAMLIGLCANFATRYYCFREKRFLVLTIVPVILAFASLFRIILNG